MPCASVQKKQGAQSIKSPEVAVAVRLFPFPAAIPDRKERLLVFYSDLQLAARSGQAFQHCRRPALAAAAAPALLLLSAAAAVAAVVPLAAPVPVAEAAAASAPAPTAAAAAPQSVAAPAAAALASGAAAAPPAAAAAAAGRAAPDHAWISVPLLVTGEAAQPAGQITWDYSCRIAKLQQCSTKDSKLRQKLGALDLNPAG